MLFTNHMYFQQIGAVSFSSTSVKQFDLNSYNNMQDVIMAIKYIPFMGGRTNTASALSVMVGLNVTSAYSVIFLSGRKEIHFVCDIN